MTDEMKAKIDEKIAALEDGLKSLHSPVFDLAGQYDAALDSWDVDNGFDPRSSEMEPVRSPTEAVASLKEFAAATRNPFDIFFNDTSIGDVGEGLNLIKGAAYCSFIPEEFGYYKVRYVILQNLESDFSNIIDKALDDCAELIGAAAKSLSKLEEQFADFNSNPEKYFDTSTSQGRYDYDLYKQGADNISEGKSWINAYVEDSNDANTMRNAKAFLSAYDYYMKGQSGQMVSISYGTIADEIEKILEKAENKIKDIAKIINEWLNLGRETLMNATFVMHILEMDIPKIAPGDISVYERLKEVKETVKDYTTKVSDAINIVARVRASHPHATMQEQSRLVRDYVIKKDNVTGKCDSILARLGEYFAGDTSEEPTEAAV